ncbi:hypothetical protein Fmac_007217 [Flemingia macrophylla]|uniref:AAA+ ATPase domain-containing protein n=1 Tax=Flemingia macrophylla TaxID=520843 RepID=A0ABD1NE26_9FABA
MIVLQAIFVGAAVVVLTVLVLVLGRGWGRKVWRSMEEWFHVYHFLRVPEVNETTTQRNHLYTKVSLYLHSLPSMEDSHSANLLSGKNQNDVVLGLALNQTIEDHFLGATLFWSNQTGAFLLKIRKLDKRRILRPYLHHIHAVADQINHQPNRDLRLFINNSDHSTWRSLPFTHPSTFDTIAMEPDLKNRLKSDLDSFLRAKHYYHRLGRVWKRSFLLYGASGTGKSSFVAAMANFLSYDVYDVDLCRIPTDSDLKLLLLHTTPKSVVVIEDLDRFLAEKTLRVTASGILNFMDGLLTSCCAEERVVVFTMNSKEHVDQNLLRPGRVDVHIHFPLCDFSAFKTLASSYLGVKEHKLFPQVQQIFQNGASLSPAEIGELMIANRNSPSRAIKSVITALQTDGDGRGCGLIGRQTADDGDHELDERNGLVCSKGLHTVKDLRKLYGIFRFRVTTRSSSSSIASVPASPLQ